MSGDRTVRRSGRPQRRPPHRPGPFRRTRAVVAAALLAGALAAGAAVSGPATASASASGSGAPTATAPLPDGPGPALSVPADRLDAALRCEPGTTGTSTPVVLFVPGTTLTPQEEFSWNYFPAFRAAGRPFCSVELPDHGMGDIQTSAEYVVNAVRDVSARSGRKVSVVGFSQGGMIARWAMRFWPDTREDIGQVVGLDPSNHGTLDSYLVCAVGGCAPAFWQQSSSSAFLTALNSGSETVAGVSYTSIVTPVLDEIVTPNLPPLASSYLNTGPGRRSNVSTWDVCPGHLADHLSMGADDAVGYALVVDALDHDGLASAARIDRAVCLQANQPGVDPGSAPARFGAYAAGAGNQLLTYPHVPAEPPLRPYAAH